MTEDDIHSIANALLLLSIGASLIAAVRVSTLDCRRPQPCEPTPLALWFLRWWKLGLVVEGKILPSIALMLEITDPAAQLLDQDACPFIALVAPLARLARLCLSAASS